MEILEILMALLLLIMISGLGFTTIVFGIFLIQDGDKVEKLFGVSFTALGLFVFVVIAWVAASVVTSY